MKLISEEYKQLNRQAHQNAGWGTTGASKLNFVSMDAKRVGAQSLLDYGCGKGALGIAIREQRLSLDVREYDPGIEGKDALPEPADYVACIDVLEHVEPDMIDGVLDHIADLMGKGGFLYPCLVPAQAILSDGRNAHLIVESADWWENKIKQHMNIVGECHRTPMYVGFYVRPITNEE